jgi:5-methylcytosine-specific restriction protein A
MPTGWVGSTRRQTLPTNWETEIVPRVLARDHHRCQHIREDTGRKCLRRARDVDHVIPYHLGGTDDAGNLEALCGWHHGKKSGREGGIASGVSRRASRDAAKPLHPGLLTERPKPEVPAPF